MNHLPSAPPHPTPAIPTSPPLFSTKTLDYWPEPYPEIQRVGPFIAGLVDGLIRISIWGCAGG